MATFVSEGLRSVLFVTQGYIASTVLPPPLAVGPGPGRAVSLLIFPLGVGVATAVADGRFSVFGVGIFGVDVFGVPVANVGIARGVGAPSSGVARVF